MDLVEIAVRCERLLVHADLLLRASSALIEHERLDDARKQMQESRAALTEAVELLRSVHPIE